MAGVFSITELKRVGSNFISSDVKFLWTAAEHSAPATSWKFGLKQRTVREDYPGAEEPTEQILGPNFSPFTVSGVWDDKYMGEGKALETRKAFEELVQRGSSVVIEFETIGIRGIITSCEFDYRRASYIGYSFEFSPHSRDRTAVGIIRALFKTPKTPSNHRDRVKEKTDAMASFNAAAPKNQIKKDLAGRITDRVEAVTQQMGVVTTAVDQRFDKIGEPFEALRRLAHGFSTIKTTAQNTISDLRVIRSDTELAWESAISILDYEVWTRGLGFSARLAVGNSHEAQQDMENRADPKALAVYQPHRGESLYAISQRFYNTPHQWRRIAERNKLTTLTLQGDELLIIPRSA